MREHIRNTDSPRSIPGTYVENVASSFRDRSTEQWVGFLGVKNQECQVSSVPRVHLALISRHVVLLVGKRRVLSAILHMTAPDGRVQRFSVTQRCQSGWAALLG